MSFAGELDEDSALPADEEDEADGCCPPDGAEADEEADVADARAVVGLGGCKLRRMLEIRSCMFFTPALLWFVRPSCVAKNRRVKFSSQY